MAAIVAVVGAHAIGGMFDVEPSGTGDHAPAIGELADSPAGLVERHGCWTGEAPAGMAGKFPGHVVVSEVGTAPRYAGAAMVRKALEQAFDGADHGLRVHAYCR